MKKIAPFFCYTLLITMFLLSVSLSTLHAQTAGRDVTFTKYHLWDEFYTEGITIADVNKDGKTDIIAGARWFEAPGWKVHDIWKHKKFDYTKGYSDSFLNYATDVNEDGWVDLICFDFPGKEVYWLENPAGVETLWKRNLIDSVASNESPMMVDVDRDGKNDLVFGNEKLSQMAWFKSSVKVQKSNVATDSYQRKECEGCRIVFTWSGLGRHK
jgi:hypothetical protein